ncbi:MAG: glycerol acyltransferase [Betaproteobacteria bacterium]|nr:glycerol acyltransferase [Betaproteobacteria bacterium]
MQASSAFQPAKRTLFNTPGLTPFLQWFSKRCMKALGWTIAGKLPENSPKAVLIAAPHTSNWDLPYSLMTCFILGIRPYWLGKASLFKFPFRGSMRWLGGIEVDRSRSHNLVSAAIEGFVNHDGPLLLMIPPEGTRSKVREWKTGFYFIAAGAGVPIVMAYLDYGKKEAGLGPVLLTTGDVNQDLARAKAFYAPIRGLRADQFDATH